MPRAKGGFSTRRRRKKILKLAKGNQGARSKLFKSAKEAVHRALAYAYRDRRNRKREFRNLWVIRIGAAAKECGISYSRLIHALKLSNITMNRKNLAAIAVSDKEGFAKIVETARQAVQA
ncbi:MAG: 50S ribosomal protein L20 [Pseudomonadota bacterium]